MKVIIIVFLKWHLALEEMRNPGEAEIGKARLNIKDSQMTVIGEDQIDLTVNQQVIYALVTSFK